MTPDKRLNQLEPVVADVLQKVDRLIEGQGQLVELATSTKAELDQFKATTAENLADLKTSIEQVKTTGEITARGLANLTIYVQEKFDAVNQRFDAVDQRFDAVDQRFDTVNQRFDTVQQDVSAIKAGQELILQILREKLP